MKVCGLTRPEHALHALRQGAAFLGLIFAAESRRRLSLPEAQRLVEAVRAETGAGAPRFVGVYVAEPIEEILHAIESLRLTAVQLHGPRPDPELGRIPVPVIRGVRVKGAESGSEISSLQQRGPILLEKFIEGKHGGTGETFDHSLAVPYLARGPVFIAGGLRPDNIAAIVEQMKNAGGLPYAFDASSGLEERPRIKSPDKITAFFRALRTVL